MPVTLKLYTNVNVWGIPLPSVTNPLKLVNVTFPAASNDWLACNGVPFWINLTEPATVSFAQVTVLPDADVNASSFTTTDSMAEAFKTTSIDVTFAWLNK
jgi:hypothetical protein